jgi:hypothetical protein
MFKNGGYNLSDIAAVTGNRNGNGDGMFGDNGWWIILLFLFAGWGGRGFGGGFGGGGSGYEPGFMMPWATQNDVRAAVDQQTLISKLDNQTYGLADSTYALNNSITTGFHGVDNAICTLGYNVQQGFNTLGHQMSDCCCTTQRLIERGFADTNYNMATQACDTRRAISDSTRDIIDANNAGVRSILDFLTQDKIATLTAENQSLKFAASQANQNAFITANQEAQTAELIRRLATPCPVPAYVVPNPNCCYNATYTTGCGCGNAANLF